MSSLSSAAVPTRAAGPPLRLSNLGDELLARYAARGGDRAFAALYERYHQRLYRYCRSILRDDADAQDALQSTFAAALAALRRGQRNAPLRPWLYKIAHNEAISLLRRRTRDAADELRDETFGAGSSVEQEVTARARWRTLLADLGRLPDRQRGALLLRELSGLSHEEIAITLGTTTAGAKQAIFEARQALAEIEQGRAMSCEEVRHRISEGDRRVLRGRKVTAHLRECSACDAFATAIPARRAELAALTPALPPAVAAALLSRSLHTSSLSAGAGGTSAAATAGLVGKGAATAVMWKTLGAIAVVATTAAGVTGLARAIHRSHSSSPPAARAGAAARSTSGHHAAVRTASQQAVGIHHAADNPAHPRRAGGGSRNAAHGKRSGLAANSQGRSAGANSGGAPVHQSATHGQGASGQSGSAPGDQTTSQGASGHSGSAPGDQTTSQGASGHSGSAPGHRAASQGTQGHRTSAPGHQPRAVSQGSHSHSGGAPGQQPVNHVANGHSGSAPGQQPVNQVANGHSGSAPGQQPSATVLSTSGQGSSGHAPQSGGHGSSAGR
jgi:RNA polymerase sigma factor (sigma-70 family)